jgi:hypothetical protein
MRCLLLLLALAACHSNPATADAWVSDAVADAAVDAPPPTVTLNITKDTVPRAGVHVYFQNADSTVVLATTTDATGTATAVMTTGGGFVTAIDPFDDYTPGTTDVIRTFAGVQPNDRLTLKASTPPQTTIAVTAKLPLIVNGSQYVFSSTCGSAYVPSTGTGPVTLAGCNGFADIAVTAIDGTGNVLGYFYKANVVAIDQGTIDLTSSNYTAMLSRTYTLTNVADPAQPPYVIDTLATPRGEVYYTATAATGSPATATLSLPGFAGAVDTVQMRQESPAAGYNERDVVAWGALTATFSADLGSQQLPDYSQMPAYAPTPPSLTWTESGGAVQPDFSLAAMNVFRSSTPRGWSWEIAAPHTAASIPFPKLPTDVFDFNVAATDTTLILALVTVKMPGGWDAARANVLSISSPTDLIAGTTGTLSYSAMKPIVRVAPKQHRQ